MKVFKCFVLPTLCSKNIWKASYEGLSVQKDKALTIHPNTKRSQNQNLFAMFYKLDSFLNIYYSQEEIFSRQNGFNFFHQLQRVQKSSRSRKNLSCRADSATAQHTSRSCEFISKHEIFLSRWRKKISQRKSVWLLAFGKEAKPFGKSSYNSWTSSTSQMFACHTWFLRFF